VRGSEYAFVNATRLQQELAARSIRDFHLLDLAPSREIRETQYAADRATKTAKRQRAELSPEFVEAYTGERLAALNSSEFLGRFGNDARRIVLFCVEREAAACHRWLVAGRLQRDLGLKVTHLEP
jgi:hypothetical protein